MLNLSRQEKYYGSVKIVDLFEDWSCSKLTSKEADDLCNKYVSDIPVRMGQLFELTKEERDKIKLDFSPESLIPLWDWFERHSALEKTRVPFRERTIFTNYASTYDLPTMQTYKIALCVADYYATTIIKKVGLPLKWGYFTKAKTLASVNQPIVLGVKHYLDLNPRVIVYNCILTSYEEGFDKEMLYKAYNSTMEDFN